MNNNNGKLPIENATSEPIYLNPQDFVNSNGTNSSGDFYEVMMVRLKKNDNINSEADPKIAKDTEIHTLKTNTAAYTGSANKTGLVASGDVVDEVFVYTNADCGGTKDGHDAPRYNKSKRAFAVYGALESGTGVYCSASNS